MKKLLLLFAVLTTIILLALGCTFQVIEGESVIVARFGDPRRAVDDPGLHFKYPPPIDQVVRIDRRIHVLDPAPAEYLTGDKKNVNIDWFLAWRVTDPRRFHVSVGTRQRAEQRLADILRSVIGDVVSAHPFSAMVSHEAQPVTLPDLLAEITTLAQQKVAEPFGVEVVAARIKRLSFPMSNKNAVFRRMEAEREAVAATFQSEGSEQYEKIKADTDRTEAEMLAEAERSAAEIRGSADAEAARIYAESIARDPELYRFLRSLEVLQDVLGERSTLILRDDHPLLQVLKGPPAPHAGKGKD